MSSSALLIGTGVLFVLLVGVNIAIHGQPRLLMGMNSSNDSGIGKSFSQFPSCTSPCVPGDESIMDQKEHGTSHVPVQKDLRWGCNWSTADRICNYNRHWAEYSGYWETTGFLSDVTKDGTITPTSKNPVIFYDSNTGKKLYQVPGKDRTWDDFLKESEHHGWPSFRDSEVNWEYVRVLENGETVSVDGTHLGHDIPDKKGNRYCLNLVSLAGRPIMDSKRN